MGEALTDRGLLRTARLGIRLLKAAADAETPDTVPIAPKRRPPLSITSHCPHQGLTTYAAAGTHSKVHDTHRHAHTHPRTHAQARTHALAYTRTGTHSCTHAQARTHALAYTRTRVHTHRHARKHPQNCTCVLADTPLPSIAALNPGIMHLSC